MATLAQKSKPDRIKIAKTRGKGYHFDFIGVSSLVKLQPEVVPLDYAKFSFLLATNDQRQRLEPGGLALVTMKKRSLSFGGWVTLSSMVM